jgi:hypothetical protein
MITHREQGVWGALRWQEGGPPDGRFGAAAAEASEFVPWRLVWQGIRRYFGRRKPDPNVPASLIEHWDGSDWTIDSSGTVQGGDLAGVAITPGTIKVAWAVGFRSTATTTPLIETRCA